MRFPRRSVVLWCGSSFVRSSFSSLSGQCRTIAIIARDGDVIHNILCSRPDRDTTCCGNVVFCSDLPAWWTTAAWVAWCRMTSIRMMTAVNWS